VLETLQRVCKYATNNEADFTRQINEMFSTQQADTVKSQRKKLKISQSRHAELDKLIQRIYEDNIAERISDKRFEILSNQYEQEQSDIIYSRYFSMERWKDPKIEATTLTILDGNRIEDYRYGGKGRKTKNIIILRISRGAELSKRDGLYDEEV
jgi:Asp-tRNA(Asn)/Glu-tRNA(Gln) amidotransferase B subunit